MVRRFCFIVFLAVWFLGASGNRTAAGQSNNPKADGGIAAYASIAPPFLSPAKDVFVTREGDPFVVTVTATCLLEDDGDTQFELLSSTPGFVHVSAAYLRENPALGYAEGIGVVYVTPQPGDAGKYTVRLQVRSCSGRVERVITFKIHVKPAPQD